MKLSFAYSPCPNDTFMFEPIVNKRIDLRGLEFDIVLDEVEQLNLAAQRETYDISKVSFNAFTQIIDRYQLLNSGCALGRNCGPMIIAKEHFELKELPNKSVAIPGRNTTANLLLTLASPNTTNKLEIVFHEIEKAILAGDVDAGLIIHESRFTYQDKGLKKIVDLGEYWEDKTQTPIPLGGIVIKRDLSDDIRHTVNQVLYDSVMYAQNNPNSGIDYIRQYAQEMEDEVMYKHIDLYVNKFSLDLGREGMDSVNHLFAKMVDIGKLDALPKDIFVKEI